MPKHADIAAFYDSFSDKLLRDYIEGNPRVDCLGQFLRDAVAAPTAGILEIGCGCGANAHYLATRVSPVATIHAVDISPRNIQLARLLFAHPRIEFRVADAAAVDLGQHDVIILPDVYEHIEPARRDAFHANLARSLAPRGRVLLTLPSPAWQRAQRAAGEPMQIVDEEIGLAELQRLAADLQAELTYYAHVNVWRTGDYVHAVIERTAEAPHRVGPTDRLGIRRCAAPYPWLGRRTLAGWYGRLRRWVRRQRVNRALRTLQAEDRSSPTAQP